MRLVFWLTFSVSFILFGCQGSSNNDGDDAKDGFDEVINNELFSARFPGMPELELLEHNEFRYLLATKECTYLVFQGFINPESQEMFRKMPENEVLTYIAEAFMQVSGALDNTYSFSIDTDGAWKMIEYKYPPETGEMAQAAWKRVYIKNDILILVLLSSPERRILDQQKKLFLKYWKLKQ